MEDLLAAYPVALLAPSEQQMATSRTKVTSKLTR